MIDIRITCYAYGTEVIDDLGWICREYNISDLLTKILINQVMRTFKSTGKVYYEVAQYVIRAPRTPDFIRTRVDTNVEKSCCLTESYGKSMLEFSVTIRMKLESFNVLNIMPLYVLYSCGSKITNYM